MHKQTNDEGDITRFHINATMNRELGQQVIETVATNPELTESQLVRESLRRELQRREHTDE